MVSITTLTDRLTNTVGQGDNLGKDKGKRTKERSIEEIIQKVSLWRRLYNGVLRDGNLVRYSLEDAATKVDVSKKSLDDYLLQLRFGKKYNFDFQKHKNDKVGVLRAFVKREKGRNKDKDKDIK